MGGMQRAREGPGRGGHAESRGARGVRLCAGPERDGFGQGREAGADAEGGGRAQGQRGQGQARGMGSGRGQGLGAERWGRGGVRGQGQGQGRGVRVRDMGKGLGGSGIWAGVVGGSGSGSGSAAHQQVRLGFRVSGFMVRVTHQQVRCVLCVLLLLAKHMGVQAVVPEQRAGEELPHFRNLVRAELHAVQPRLRAAKLEQLRL